MAAGKAGRAGPFRRGLRAAMDDVPPAPMYHKGRSVAQSTATSDGDLLYLVERNFVCPAVV